jgi:hypothetical protein
LFATALTLILVPVLYSIIDRATTGFKNLMFGETGSVKEPSVVPTSIGISRELEPGIK